MEDKKAVGFRIRTLNNLFMRKMESITARHGDDATAVAHGWILDYLSRHREQDIYQKDLENRFGLSRSSVTCILKALEERGCITRESVNFDARLKKIVILPKGVEVMKMGKDDIHIIESILEKDISKEDLEVFYKVTEQVKKNILDSYK